MQSLLFGVQPIDPATYGVATGALAAIAVAACAVPALRATRVDPLARCGMNSARSANAGSDASRRI